MERLTCKVRDSHRDTPFHAYTPRKSQRVSEELRIAREKSNDRSGTSLSPVEEKMQIDEVSMATVIDVNMVHASRIRLLPQFSSCTRLRDASFLYALKKLSHLLKKSSHLRKGPGKAEQPVSQTLFEGPLTAQLLGAL